MLGEDVVDEDEDENEDEDEDEDEDDVRCFVFFDFLSVFRRRRFEVLEGERSSRGDRREASSIVESLELGECGRRKKGVSREELGESAEGSEKEMDDLGLKVNSAAEKNTGERWLEEDAGSDVVRELGI